MIFCNMYASTWYPAHMLHYVLSTDMLVCHPDMLQGLVDLLVQVGLLVELVALDWLVELVE